MNWTIILATACGIAVTQGLFLGMWLLVKDHKGTGSNMFLGITMLALSLRIGKSLVYYFWPNMSLWGVGMGGAGLWAIGPSVLLYLFAIHGLKIKRKHALLFTPSLFLLFSATLFNWRDMHVAYQFGIVYLLILLIAGVANFWKSPLLFQKQPIVLLVGILAIAGAFIFQITNRSIESYALGGLCASFVLYAINMVVTTTQLSKARSKSSHINDSTSLEPVLAKIKLQLESDRLYRQPKLTLSKLSEIVDEPVYIVRQAIVQLEGKNFNEYINSYRIDEVKKLLEKDSHRHTIEGMALDVGFTSISSFYEAFKRITNCTPVEYKKNQI